MCVYLQISTVLQLVDRFYFRWRLYYPKNTNKLPQIANNFYLFLLYPMHLVAAGDWDHSYCCDRLWFHMYDIETIDTIQQDISENERKHTYTWPIIRNA